jgi:uncharacterized damage-inducible protein DinB
VLDELLEAWRTNQRINLYLIDHISEEGMSATLSKHGGRNVAGQFAHLHNLRVWHLQKRAKDLSDGLATFETKTSPGKDDLRKALSASSDAVEAFLAAVLSGEPKRRGFKKGIFTTLGYLIAHESHHRGSIILTLKTSGHPLDRKAAYAIWGWDQM